MTGRRPLQAAGTLAELAALRVCWWGWVGPTHSQY